MVWFIEEKKYIYIQSSVRLELFWKVFALLHPASKNIIPQQSNMPMVVWWPVAALLFQDLDDLLFDWWKHEFCSLPEYPEDISSWKAIIPHPDALQDKLWSFLSQPFLWIRFYQTLNSARSRFTRLINRFCRHVFPRKCPMFPSCFARAHLLVLVVFTSPAKNEKLVVISSI